MRCRERSDLRSQQLFKLLSSFSPIALALEKITLRRLTFRRLRVHHGSALDLRKHLSCCRLLRVEALSGMSVIVTWSCFAWQIMTWIRGLFWALSHAAIESSCG